MNGNVERIIMTLAVVSFAFTSVSLLAIREVPLTKEEAIEISKGSSLVKEGLAVAYSTSVEAHYYNSQRIEQLREWHQEEIFKNVPKDEFWEEKVPKGHSVWEIIWYFHKGVGGYSIIVVVDAEVGVIITEEKGIVFLQEELTEPTDDKCKITCQLDVICFCISNRLKMSRSGLFPSATFSTEP